MNDKKISKIFIILFILFAVTGFWSTINMNLMFLPILFWIVAAISIVVFGAKQSKSIKKNLEDKDKTEKFSQMFDGANSKYDKCDNSECDAHKRNVHVKKCPLCNAVNDSNAHYCKICGEELDKDIF